ncbi:putative zinc-binding metallopeptidase [uncultured Maribacter sp.]|uniref:zinc-binding metallopeptidase family protein n=1 Tax=uncultured Maribacter sp. TaxID=431308 RepID=UPI002611C6EB|nr:putative zinc-binding metallopeptidase [uncultured Maribacter sp.]
MKLFQCTNCKNTVVFENNVCVNCGYLLGYSSYYNKIVALDTNVSKWEIPELDGKTYEYCENFKHKVCNWLVDTSRGRKFCLACSLNRTIPHILDDANLAKWKHIEIAKHRLVYQLLRFSLPVVSKIEDELKGFCFDFLAKEDLPEESKDTKTGHANGVITLLISEADPVVREQVKQQMAERYRTLLGHFRHEVGHYFWDLLIRDNPEVLADFRNIFGDESKSYADALTNHYNNGPQANWQQNFISKYASSHPWEDWAETWSHYLHLTDILETAYNFGLKSNPKITAKQNIKMNASFDPYKETSFEKIMDTGIPLLFTLNSMNRSMGEDDLYPFIISEPVKKKLAFIRNLVKGI